MKKYEILTAASNSLDIPVPIPENLPVFYQGNSLTCTVIRKKMENFVKYVIIIQEKDQRGNFGVFFTFYHLL